MFQLRPTSCDENLIIATCKREKRIGICTFETKIFMNYNSFETLILKDKMYAAEINKMNFSIDIESSN